MDYINLKEIFDNIDADNLNGEFIETMKTEVEDFFEDFNDDPKKLSQWAHHYFCKDDGGLLIFDAKKPNEHVCSTCGRRYIDDELYNGVWITMYRNLGVTSSWKSALLYKVTNEEKYLKYVIEFASFYTDNYHKFQLHKKDNTCYESRDEAEWGCARIMPQSLNECIFIIKLVNALEIVKEKLPKDFICKIESDFMRVAFEDIKPQVDKINNIRCWFNSACVVMGLFLGNNDMVDFAYNNEYNINRQLKEGVTKDNIWYEGSIHYNFFMLEAVVNQLMFCKIYNRDYLFGEKVVEKMLISAYNYAFDNHQFPNPNDGWPNINLKTYSYIYAMAVKVYGKHSKVADLLSSILNNCAVRGTLPLSRPYYYKNELSLEEFIFAQGVRDKDIKIEKSKPYCFESSYCGMIKNENVNIFIKYGHNGPSHAHIDKMNIEVMMNGLMLSRDLSNPGYGNPYCDEWHRVSASHNTVMVDGNSHTNIYDGGECIEFTDKSIAVKCNNVYEGVDYKRNLQIKSNGYTDIFDVFSSNMHTYDYIFHVEGKLLSDVTLSNSDLGYFDNGYQHISNVQEIKTNDENIELLWDVQGMVLKSTIMLNEKKLFIASTPGNPVNEQRTAIIIRSESDNMTYKIKWKMEE